MRKFLLFNLLLPLLIFTISFSVYVYTLYPSIAPGDSTEMVVSAYVLGVPHQPSYPLNTLLGNIASKIPVPLNVVERINAVSSFLQAITAVLLYFLVVNLYRHSEFSSESLFRKRASTEIPKQVRDDVKRITPNMVYFAAFSSSFFLSFSFIYWQYATKFEVFPLNNFFAVLILLIAVKISLIDTTRFKNLILKNSYKFSKKIKRNRDRNDGDTNKVIKKEWRKFILLSVILIFFAGMGFGHHQTIILVFPAVIVLLFDKLKFFFQTKKTVIFYFLIFILGLLPFFYLLIKIAASNPPLNWGEVKTVGDAFSALIRKDYGTVASYLVGFEEEIRPNPVNQIVFYFKNMLADITIMGGILAISGIYYLWKREKKVLIFILTGFVVSGLLFLSYANFPYADSFNQATLRRFHMLPNIFIIIFISFGLLFLYEKINRIIPKQTDQKMGLLIGKAILILLFVFPLINNFTKVNNKDNNFTLSYSRDVYSRLPDNALVMLSGDIPNMTVDFYRYVDSGKKDQRITFSPGQFHLKWFIPRLNRKYPDLVIPDPMPGKRFTSTTQVVDANFGKWPIYVGPDLVSKDPELDKKYTLWPKHLLFLVKKKGEDLKLEEYREENNKLWENVNLELMNKIKKTPPMFEDTLIFHYLRHFYNLGHVFEEVELFDDAIREYERVLKIDPVYKEAYLALARVYGYKREKPDYIKAIGYLRNYQSVLGKNDIELLYAAEDMIYELQGKAVKEYQNAQKEEMERQKQASESASIASDSASTATLSAEEEKKKQIIDKILENKK